MTITFDDKDERTLSKELQAKLKDGRAFWVDKYEPPRSSKYAPRAGRLHL